MMKVKAMLIRALFVSIPMCSSRREFGNVADGTPPMMLCFSLSLTPRTQLASLPAVCAAEGSIKLGMAHGMAFGLGAALTPMLILLPLISLLGSNLRENREWITRWIRWGAAAVLVVLGLRRIFLGV